MFFRSNHSNKQWEGQSCARVSLSALGLYRAELFVRRAPRLRSTAAADPCRLNASLAARRSHPHCTGILRNSAAVLCSTSLASDRRRGLVDGFPEGAA